jgi:hypothetical protein
VTKAEESELGSPPCSAFADPSVVDVPGELSIGVVVWPLAAGEGTVLLGVVSTGCLGCLGCLGGFGAVVVGTLAVVTGGFGWVAVGGGFGVVAVGGGFGVVAVTTGDVSVTPPPGVVVVTVVAVVSVIGDVAVVSVVSVVSAVIVSVTVVTTVSAMADAAHTPRTSITIKAIGARAPRKRMGA